MQQNWLKRDLIFRPSGELAWMRTHAQVPTPYWTREGRLRVYFGSRDERSRTSTVFLEVEPENPGKSVLLQEEPVLPLGALGCFDDCGVMPGCVVDCNGQAYLYYTGWNTSTTVPYRLSIGLAVSEDGGVSFRRIFDGPILDRTPREPHLCGAPFVLRDGPTWRMWYSSGTEWLQIDGRAEPRYLIRYAESSDGIDWQRPGTIAIDYARPDEALARPWVIKEGPLYRMWFSSRSIKDYRRDSRQSYHMGYAESSDGISWTRLDELVDLHVSPAGWDSEMIAYPAVFDAQKNRRYLLYNGNGFGASGFGLAELGRAA